MLGRLLRNRRVSRANLVITHIAAITVENLEQRRLLSTVPFTTAATTGLLGNPLAAAVYLTSDFTPGDVQVRYGSLTGTIYHTFTGLSDTDSIVSPSAGVTFYQEVTAALAPTGGIQVSGGSGGTLEVDAGDTDQLIQLVASNTSSGTIRSEDAVNSAQGDSIYGAGITHLIIRTNNVAGSSTADGTVVNVATAGAGSMTGLQLPSLSVATSVLIDTGSATYDTINVGGGDDASANGVMITTGAGNDRVNITSYDNDNTPEPDIDGTASANIDFGAGTGIGDGLGLGDSLHVNVGGTATLAYHTPTSHTVVVDTVNTASVFSMYPASVIVSTPALIGTATDYGPGASLEVDADSTIDSLDVSNHATATFTAETTLGSATIENTSTATFTGTAASTVTTLDDGGTTTVEAAANITTLTVDSGGTIDFTTSAATATIGTATINGTATVEAAAAITTLDVGGGGTIDFTPTGTSTIGTATIDGIATFEATATITTLDVTGDAYLQAHSTVTTLNQSAGLVKLGLTDTWRDTGNAFGYTISTINITGGQLDVNGEDVLTTVDTHDHPAPTSFSTLFSYLYSGYDGGDWAGSGITSSFAIASYALTSPSAAHYAIGYATMADGLAGLSLSDGQVLLRPTRVGDANLDGTTGLADYNLLAPHLNHSPTDWAQGDFNYDNATALADYNLLAANFNLSFPT